MNRLRTLTETQVASERPLVVLVYKYKCFYLPKSCGVDV